MQNPMYTLRLSVRDYECDLQGIVNNAVYQHYTEHTRSQFVRSRGCSLEALHAQGIDTVVARLEMQFKAPLRPADEFDSHLRLVKDGLKYIFHQELIRVSDQTLCLRATTTIVCRIHGRLGDSPLLEPLLRQP